MYQCIRINVVNRKNNSVLDIHIGFSPALPLQCGRGHVETFHLSIRLRNGKNCRMQPQYSLDTQDAGHFLISDSSHHYLNDAICTYFDYSNDSR